MKAKPSLWLRTFVWTFVSSSSGRAGLAGLGLMFLLIYSFRDRRLTLIHAGTRRHCTKLHQAHTIYRFISRKKNKKIYFTLSSRLGTDSSFPAPVVEVRKKSIKIHDKEIISYKDTLRNLAQPLLTLTIAIALEENYFIFLTLYDGFTIIEVSVKFCSSFHSLWKLKVSVAF